MNARARETVSTLGIVLLGAACGQSELSPPAASNEGPVQGEPIEAAVVQGEPIVPLTELEPALEATAEPVAETIAESVGKQIAEPATETDVISEGKALAAETNEAIGAEISPMKDEPETLAATDGVESEISETAPVVIKTLSEGDLQALKSDAETVTEAVAVALDTDTVPEATIDAAQEAVEEVRETIAAVGVAEELSLSDQSVDETIRELETLRLDKGLDKTGVIGDESAIAPTRLADGSLDISFDRLASFDYEMPEDLTSSLPGEGEGASNQIPDAIRKLNDQSIALKGFMLPLKVEEGLVTEMLIMRDQSMCCYGTVPKINEWVSVRMIEGKGVKPVMDQAVTLFGKLKVGEIRENGYLVGIYEMDGDRMDGPADL